MVPIFVAKYQFDPSIFFISIWSLFWEIWCNQVFSVNGVVTVLNGCHVSVSRFFEWFLFFFIFLFWIFFLIFKKIKNMPRVKLTLCHVAVIVSHVTIMLGVVFSFSIWSMYFNFCLNLIPIFVKIVQFRPPQIETKINFYIDVIQIFLLNLIFLFKLIFLLYIFKKSKFI